MLCRYLGVVSVPLLAAVVCLSSAAQQEKPAARHEQILKRFAGEFLDITPGKGKYPASFQMGSAAGPANEKPVHTVAFDYPFAVCKYETTQELYETVMGKNPSRWQGPRNSVEMITWDEANTFCRLATDELRKLKLIGMQDVIRLPSEAEWEYACRAGTTTSYSFGDEVQSLTDFCWFTGNAKGNDPPVGAKKANPWQLYDVHGYIWEWCADEWHDDYEGAPKDGSAWLAGDAKQRVVRGGAWTETADRCRSSTRHHEPIATRTAAIGFRCVRGRAP